MFSGSMGNGRVLASIQKKNNVMSGNGGNEGGSEESSNNNECSVREQDRFMPIANVIRIMRKILPQHAKISDDAKETIQECVSEYISFITGEANERCQREQRKTITAEDVLWAMSKLGFDDYIEPLTLYLHRYRELEGDRGSIRTCEPLLKMSRAGMEQYAAFGPGPGTMFHIGPPAYYGGPSSVNGGYIKEGSDVAAAAHNQSNAGNSFESYALHK
ncbi:hypothetical protein RND81_05G245500 [Saponaria officinalis]|uniref:Transcription factor CBF/NF-Y/archaeal histone domain-containing protein n=1 Tax=Saponaria officinalis TaxID=3572 RepID=A0AAW1KW52_SAPOF